MADRAGRRRLLIGGGFLLAAALAAGCAAATSPAIDGSGAPSRLDEVRASGAPVMGFDLDASQHFFLAAENGGTQWVLALDAADEAEIAEIRDHLRKVVDDFATGDFSDPEAIHGQEMPGLAVLREAGDRLRLTYADEPVGGRIEYESRDPAVVAAIGEWFDAQVEDHGPDAIPADPAGITEEMWRAHHPGEPVPDWVIRDGD